MANSLPFSSPDCFWVRITYCYGDGIETHMIYVCLAKSLIEKVQQREAICVQIIRFNLTFPKDPLPKTLNWLNISK